MKIDFNNKLLLKIFSAVIAIFLWVAITYTEDPIISQVISNIDIRFEGEEKLEDRGLIITNRDSMPDISVVIRGNRSNVISSIGSITAVADVSGINNEGQNMVLLKYNYPSNGVTLVKSRTQEITIETEKLVTRSIPVRFETENEDKNLTHLVDANLNENSVKIRGAESEVYKIAYAQAIVDISEIISDGEQEYPYKFYNENDNIVQGKTIIYKNPKTIKITTKAYKKVNVPVNVIIDEELSEDYILKVKSVSEQSVEVGVSEDILAPDKIDAVVYDINEKQAKIKLNIPEGVYVPEEKQTIKVEYQIVPKVMKNIEVDVTAINVPEGKTAVIEPKKINISVKGAENEISADKIKAEIDMSLQNNGQIQFNVPDGIDIIGDYFVEAELN